MIPSTMNRAELKKNIGKTFQFFPIPRRDSASGSYESDKNQWLLRRETPDKKGFEFLNMLGDYNPLVLDSPKINKFDEPDVLILRGQVIFDGSTVRYEPFTPKPASLSVPSTSLRLYLEDADQNGVSERGGSSVQGFRFWVCNTGEQTVRDYRVTLLVPSVFTRPPYGMFEGYITKQYDTTVGEQEYGAYEMFASQPIYKNDSIKIGEVLLSTVTGYYIFRWQIRCVMEFSHPKQLMAR